MKEASANILLIALDDDAEELEILKSILIENNVSNYQLHTSIKDFFDNIKSDINLCIIDHKLPIKDGLEITKEVKQINPANYVIITSGIRDFDVAVAYLNARADKFLKKSDPDYNHQLVKALREGFAEAGKRIETAKELKAFYEIMKEKSRQTDELIKQLK